jgi:hypothetical protein
VHLFSGSFKTGENARRSGQTADGRRGAFDVFIDSSRFCSTPPKSTQFVEAFWRRREPVPDALCRKRVRPLRDSCRGPVGGRAREAALRRARGSCEDFFGSGLRIRCPGARPQDAAICFIDPASTA